MYKFYVHYRRSFIQIYCGMIEVTNSTYNNTNGALSYGATTRTTMVHEEYTP